MMRDIKATLAEGPIGKILFKLTVPMIFGMVAMVAFNLVDTFFVGKLGTDELAAMSFTFPVVMALNGIALGLGIGAAAVISNAIGKGNMKAVRRLTTDSLILAALIVAVFASLGLLTIKPLFKLLGAKKELLPLIYSYMRVWYLGVVFVVFPMVGNNAIRATGDTKTPALIMMCAVTMNVILDPLLIFGLGPFPRLGLTGAALATVFSRMTTFAISSWVLIKRYKMVTFEKTPIREIWDSWKKILYIGLPSALTRVIMPIGIGVITKFVSMFGKEAVAGLGVATRIGFFAMTIIWALSSVIAPFIGQNWGSKKPDRVRKGLWISYRFSFLYGLGLFIILYFIAPLITPVFNGDPEVHRVSTLYLRILSMGYGLQGIFIISNSALNVLHRPLWGALITAIQMFLLYIPLAFLGMKFMGLNGIFLGGAISYVISGLIGAKLALNFSREVYLK